MVAHDRESEAASSLPLDHPLRPAGPLKSAMRRPPASQADRRQPQRAPNAKPKLTQKDRLLKLQTELKKQAERTVMAWQERLFEGAVDEQLLTTACKYFQPAHLEEVVTERNCEDLCGYPLCDQKRQIVKGKYRVSLKANKILDTSEMKSFCGQGCMVASRYLSTQLSKEAIYARDVNKIARPALLPPRLSAEEIAATLVGGEGTASRTELRENYVSNMLSEVTKSTNKLSIVENEQRIKPSPPIEGRKIESSDGCTRVKAGCNEVEGVPIHSNGSLPKSPHMEKFGERQRADQDIFHKHSPYTSGANSIMDKLLGKESAKGSSTRPGLATPSVFRAGNHVVEAFTQLRQPEHSNYESADVGCDDQLKLPARTTTMTSPEAKRAPSRRRPAEQDDFRRRPSEGSDSEAKSDSEDMPQMSLFGRLWTLLDRMITEQTVAYMGVSSVDDFKLAEEARRLENDDDTRYKEITRREILSERILLAAAELRLRLKFQASIEYEIVELIKTLRLSESMVVLDSREDMALALVFIKSLLPKIPSLEISFTSTSTSSEVTESPSQQTAPTAAYRAAVTSCALSVEAVDILVDMVHGGRWLNRHI